MINHRAYARRIRRRHGITAATPLGLELPNPNKTTYGVYSRGMNPWARGLATESEAETEAVRANNISSGMFWAAAEDGTTRVSQRGKAQKT